LTPICNAGTRDIPVNNTMDITITANFDIIFSAISDLKLLADRLPDNRQQEIFDYAKIKAFVSTMLRQPVWLDPNHDKFDARRTRLAAILAEESLKKCIDQYKNKIEKSEVLSKQNVSLLENAISLCNEIAIRVQLLETESKTKE
jgi:hypothetical protein